MVEIIVDRCSRCRRKIRTGGNVFFRLERRNQLKAIHSICLLTIKRLAEIPEVIGKELARKIKGEINIRIK